MDGLVRVNGETSEVSPLRSPERSKPPSPLKPEQETPCEQTVTVQKTVERAPPPPQTERPGSATSSAISSLIGGRSCIITTTIVTELTHVEPVTPSAHTNGQVRAPGTGVI